MERKFFEDNELVHAVINSDFDKVKKLVETKYQKPITDIGGFVKQCPIFIIPLCLDMCFEAYPDNEVFKERNINNGKILDLFVAQFNLGKIDEAINYIQSSLNLLKSLCYENSLLLHTRLQSESIRH